ncbi:glycyl-radical enzyme activating protein [Parabacteroides sp. OttesenSCG-928-G06]|nr:glycyl-radical enzyme activating protein [Parabacteroides sp. OttesenSCG-928-K15]MDL2281708.1 glycyl-radical enzyme activating protein [Parabacteroides sp. OttesenSCG-928-G06]
MEAFVFDIKRYAINDGPGIRVTVFFKGCPLSCVWCHNPEGISSRKEKLYTPKKCLGCGNCVAHCPQKALSLTRKGIRSDDQRCALCATCCTHCPSLAMELSGKDYTMELLMQEIEKETLVMDHSGGGVTFSGGEPFMQPHALLELLQRCKQRGIHRTIDTTLHVKPAHLEACIPHTNLFLVDLKVMDPAKHQCFCGVSNTLILDNIRLLASVSPEYIIRIPLIDGINTDTKNVEDTARFLTTLQHPPLYIDLLPYHDNGRSKHHKRGSRYNPVNIKMRTPAEETMERCRSILKAEGLALS